MGNCLSCCLGGNRREYQTIEDHEQISLMDNHDRDSNRSTTSNQLDRKRTSNSFREITQNASNGAAVASSNSNGRTSSAQISINGGDNNNNYTPNVTPLSNLSSGNSDGNSSGPSSAELRNIITKHSAVSSLPHALSSTQKASSFSMNYELKDEMGIGSTSKCYRCVRKQDGKEFACKVIDKRQVEMKFSGLLDQFYVEIQVLRTLNHPNIIHLEDTFESNERIYIIMELMKGGELFDYVVEKGTLSEEEASVLVRKITSAVAHMHNQDIIHRDLKPENLLLTNRGPNAEVKLIDFGLAKIMAEPVASSFLGTKGYLAPEMLQRHSYDKAIDMWALGVIVFVLLCGCLPFDDDSSRITNDAAARKKFTLRFPKWAATLSAPAKDLLHNLLEINPKARYTADQALNHPWVSGKAVQLNSYLQSPCILGEKRKDLRSPQQYNIPEMYDRVSGGSSRAGGYGTTSRGYRDDNDVGRNRKNSI